MKNIKKFKKGLFIGFIFSVAFILISGFSVFTPEGKAELERHALPLWGYFAIMAIFYVPIFMVLGGLAGWVADLIKNRKK